MALVMSANSLAAIYLLITAVAVWAAFILHTNFYKVHSYANLQHSSLYDVEGMRKYTGQRQHTSTLREHSDTGNDTTNSPDNSVPLSRADFTEGHSKIEHRLVNFKLSTDFYIKNFDRYQPKT